jgi:hypothetical protein
MRRRRAEMAQAGRSNNADPNASAARERSGTSLLKEIDDALEQVNNGLNIDTLSSEWVREGDITSTVLPITPQSAGPPSLVRFAGQASTATVCSESNNNHATESHVSLLGVCCCCW